MFDLDPDSLAKANPGQNYTNAYADIKNVLEPHGFEQQQGGVYFGNVAKVDAVICVLAAMDVAAKLPWLAPAIKDIRMLRIEDDTDLMPAIQRAVNC